MSPPNVLLMLTGPYPSLHGVTQTDGLARGAEDDDMLWLAPDTAATLGDWFRAAAGTGRSLRCHLPCAPRSRAC